MPDIFIPKKKESPEKKSETKKPEASGETNLTKYPSHHLHHLSSFDESPTGICFQNQEGDERILLFLRKHIITNLPWVFVGSILILLPFIIALVSSFLGQTSVFTILPYRFTVVFLIFYYLIVFNYIFISFITWFYNISLVTQKRVIDIDFSDLVYHDMAVTKLNLVEDVHYAQTGFIRSFFNYGDVYIQTAGEMANFDFLAVPQPRKAVHIIQDLIGKEKHA